MRLNLGVFHGSGVSIESALSARTLREWWTAVTCPLRGHATPEDFLASVSYSHALARAVTPLLFIGAEGDPVCPAGTTSPQESGSVILARAKAGGHIAFPTGAWPFEGNSDTDWDRLASLEFCAAALADADEHTDPGKHTS